MFIMGTLMRRALGLTGGGTRESRTRFWSKNMEHLEPSRQNTQAEINHSNDADERHRT